MGFDAEAGAKPQHRSGVLGDIGLVQRDSKRHVTVGVSCAVIRRVTDQAGERVPKLRCGCRYGQTFIIAARMPIKLRRNASLWTFPRPEATGPSAAARGLPGAVCSADGTTG